MPIPRRSALSAFALALGVTGAAHGIVAQAPRPPAGPAVRPILWAEARPIVDRLEHVLPPGLRAMPAAERASRWSDWLAARRKELTRRLSEADDDSVVNLFLFGTSFTKEPRITQALLRDLDQRWKAGDRSAQDTLARHYQRRAADLVAAAADPRAGERMETVRGVMAARGHDVSTSAGRGSSIDYLFASLARVREDAARLAAGLETARRAPDATARFAERSRVFRDRGLSGDSSVLTQFAVDRAICALRDRGVMVRPVTRVAIVGPGLDFADKQEGFDFYPPQSLQPFTLADSLLRCGLASRQSLRLTTLDVNERVNGHLRRAVARGSYRLVLPWDTSAGWTGEAEAYWKAAGDRIGTPFAGAPGAGGLPDVRARGIAVAPDIVGALRPLEASITSDRVVPAASERFDLVLATNVLVYYDTFEQTLALAGIAGILRPGGVLLTNDALLEIPEVPMRSGGYLTVRFSGREEDGERMVWYLRSESPQSAAR